MENDDNITFETMPDFGGMFRSGATSKTQVVEEKEYEFLYDELLDKCNPSKFKIESVGLEKFNVANEIYAQLKSGGSDVPEGILITLRNRAMDELGVYISTKKKFDSSEIKLSFMNFMSLMFLLNILFAPENEPNLAIELAEV